ncbi:DUF924 family protein [Microdochium nivale]|nr:DUF924 family protein [Microdochium nivale]
MLAFRVRAGAALAARAPSVTTIATRLSATRTLRTTAQRTNSTVARPPATFRPYSSATITATPVIDMDPRATEVLDYWFSLDVSDWFQTPTEARDQEIRTLFGALVSEARTPSSDLEASWTATPEGTLALLLLLDQFPRNIYRGSAESFSSDPQACRIAIEAIARGFDREIMLDSLADEQPEEPEPSANKNPTKKKVAYFKRMFFYLPLMHAEDLAAQVACCALYEVLLRDCPDARPEKRHISTEFAARHRDCILLHGRFPKRNAWLGRETTPEERTFLEINPMGF